MKNQRFLKLFIGIFVFVIIVLVAMGLFFLNQFQTSEKGNQSSTPPQKNVNLTSSQSIFENANTNENVEEARVVTQEQNQNDELVYPSLKPMPQVNEKYSKVYLNNIKLYWLNDVKVIKTNHNKSNWGINGYDFVKTTPKQGDFGIFDENNLYVVADIYDNDRRIITGEIIVKFSKNYDVQLVAQKYDLDVIYSDPGSTVFKLKQGQSIIDKMIELENSDLFEFIQLDLRGRSVKAL